jgi:tRNA A-37 threonylcarbamoyl transferase component Bud32
LVHDETLFRDPIEAATTPRLSGPDRARPAEEEWLPAAGSILADRYRIGAVIGAGGMGSVVRAERVLLGEAVAVKFLHPRLAADPESRERFLREAKATSRIKNEHVVRIIDVGATNDGLPYMVMDLLEGNDLADVVARGPLAMSDAVDYVLQACEALVEAHAVGIIHRDIKPSNLWLTRRSDGTALVKVLDFGISKLSPSGVDSKLTETSAVFGSPTYMSPEQIRSSKKVDSGTDVWSLGVVLHELLTQRLPFEAETSAGVLAGISADPPIKLRSVWRDAPPELEGAILACLEKDVGRRASLAELALLLRPMASPIGAVAAARLGRMGPPGDVRPLPSWSPAQAFGVTEGSLAFATNANQRATRLRSMRVAGVVAFVLMALGVAAFTLTRGQPTAVASSQPTAASTPPLPPLPPTPQTAEPAMPPVASIASGRPGTVTASTIRTAQPRGTKVPALGSAPATSRLFFTPPTSSTADGRK